MKGQTRYEFLIRTIQAISSILDPSGILEKLADNVKSFFGADGLEFLVVADEDDMSFWSDKEIPHLKMITEDEIGAIPEIGRIIRGQEVVIVRVEGADDLSEGMRELIGGIPNVTVLGLPVIRDGSGIGAGIARFKGDRGVDQDDLLLLQTTVNLAGNLVFNVLMHQRVKEIGERYETLVEHLGAGMIIIQDNKIKFANNAMVELSGYSKEELYSKPFYEFISPRDRRRMLESYSRRLKGDDVPETYGFWGIRKDEGEVYVEGIYSIVPYGGRDAVVAVLRDATRDLELRKELERASKLEGLAVLSGGIAHNFNNLLTGIMGNATLIKLSLDPQDQNYRRAAVIETLSERGARLVNRLLMFAQRIGEEKRIIELNRFISGKVDSLREDFVPESVRLNFIPSIDPITVRVAPGALGTAIQCLIENSVEAMPDGGRIDVSIKREGDYAVVSVSDTGRGIPREMLDRLFDPFYSTKDPSEGAGLGLAMVYGIANEHGGYVRVENGPESGSTSSIYLPIVEGIEPIRREEGDVILIVEEAPLVKEMLKHMLNEYGYSTVEVGNFRDAVRKIDELGDRMKLIILDLTISGMERSMVTFEIFRNRSPRTKIIGTSSEPSDERIMGYGAAGFLLKPFSLNQLITTVENALKLGGMGEHQG